MLCLPLPFLYSEATALQESKQLNIQLLKKINKDDFILRTRLTEMPRAVTAFSQPCEDLLHQCDHVGFPSFLRVSELSGWLPDPSRSHLQKPVCGCGRGAPTPGVPPQACLWSCLSCFPPTPTAAVLSRLGFAPPAVLLENINTRSTQMSTYQLSLQPSLDTAQHLTLFS